MSYQSRLIVAIAAAKRDGFHAFAAGLRELLRREQGHSVVTIQPDVSRERCESPKVYPNGDGMSGMDDPYQRAEFDRRDANGARCNG